jgi:hypothetical protein
MEVWRVCVVMLARSSGGAFHTYKAMSASMTLIVLKGHYARVEGLNQIIDGELGAILSGLLLSVWGGFRREIVTTLGAVTATGGSLFLMAFAPSRMLYVAVAIGLRSWFAVAGAVLLIGGIVELGVRPLRHIEGEAEERRAEHSDVTPPAPEAATWPAGTAPSAPAPARTASWPASPRRAHRPG